MKEINIIIPTYNEKENILSLIISIKKFIPKAIIIIVDDTPNNNDIGILIKKNKISRVLYFHRKNSKGRGSAVLYGLKFSFKNNVNQIFIEMDADFSHSPKELIRNLNYFKKNKLDLLISSRYLKDSSIINWPLSRRLFSKLSNILAYLILRINVSDYTNGFRIYSNKSIKIILNKCGNIGDGFIILSEILLAININKLKIGEIHSKFVNRLRGESSVNIYLIFNSLYGLFKLFFIKKRYLIKKNEI